ncbi:hypothetical protein SAMD00019534_123120 [Acytostelium subglobosum LB1]|uniref:hypothetical protein n=1 Tax=Acytostelium subglobosum LB1 TaxID=1410327 RepID=UPI000644CE42|nr:hypothetical protein SAMD00019534_123120 [Acytostelium subglobosum LB1]GAM29136.1 hypothetical protein SAMD00019534_123120 [Acytostelium subglobosum LB1]|eukprot:XP_012747981.1 hypothetical protein SAMD00019534_123120 [Acytostelium subglobosum LB1]
MGHLPPNLSNVTFGYRFNKPLKRGSIPSSVGTVEFGRKYNLPIFFGCLPRLLHTLRIGAEFYQMIESGTIPHLFKLVLICDSSFRINFFIPNPMESLPSSLQTINLQTNNFHINIRLNNISDHSIILSKYLEGGIIPTENLKQLIEKDNCNIFQRFIQPQ